MTGLTGDALARALEVDRKTVTNWLHADPPCPSTGAGKRRRFNLKQVVDWFVLKRTRELEQELLAMKGGAPTKDDVADARKRQAIAEAALVELTLAERRADVVRVEDAAAAAGEIGDRLQSVLANLAANYQITLERLGIEPERAQPVLDSIAADLTGALRAALEAMDADDRQRDPPVAA